jgi:signal peptidase complex subunit 3
LKRWGAKSEELASLRFDIRTDLNPILQSYNTKQLFIYLTASYDEGGPSNMTVGDHEVVLWDRIITRGDMKDIRATGQKVKTSGGPKRGRGNVRVEEGKNKYQWRNPGGTFR